MVTHLAYCVPNSYGGHNYGTVCGLSNEKSSDGFFNTNRTDNSNEVTCKKCLAIMANPKHWRYQKYIERGK